MDDNLFSKSSIGRLVSQLGGNTRKNKVSLHTGKSNGLKLNLDLGQDLHVFDHFDVIIGSAGSYLAKAKRRKLQLGLEHWLDLTGQATFFKNSLSFLYFCFRPSSPPRTFVSWAPPPATATSPTRVGSNFSQNTPTTIAGGLSSLKMFVFSSLWSKLKFDPGLSVGLRWLWLFLSVCPGTIRRSSRLKKAYLGSVRALPDCALGVSPKGTSVSPRLGGVGFLVHYIYDDTW